MGDKDSTNQLIIYSILSNLTWQKKVSESLDKCLGLAERKELENKIESLEEDKLDLQKNVDSLSKVKTLQDEEMKTLKERKKFLEKRVKELEQQYNEVLSEKNLLESKVNTNDE